MDLMRTLLDNTIEICWALLVGLLVALAVGQFLFMKDTTLGKLLHSIVGYGKVITAHEKYSLLCYMPKSYFSHFYVTSVFCTMFLLADLTKMVLTEEYDESFIIGLLAGKGRRNYVDVFTVFTCLVLMLAQGCRRLYECLYVSRHSPTAKISILQYLLGCGFYLLEPLSLVSKIGPPGDLAAGSPRLPHVFGVVMFLLASLLQHRAFLKLAGLRTGSDTSSYKMPSGGAFDFVSCPHYLAEILIYVSLTIVIGSLHYTWSLVLLFVVVIHVNMAKMSHDWYRSRFKNYPRHRKSLIPFVF